MGSRKRAFTPVLEGRLEDRLVLSGVGTAPGGLVPSQVHHHPPAPRQAILMTRQYSRVLTGIHMATVQLGRGDGSPAAYDRAARQIVGQLWTIPYSRQSGLVDRVTGALPSYGVHQAGKLYGDIRQTLIVYLGHEVDEGRLLVRTTPQSFFSDADLVGDDARIHNPENSFLYDAYILGISGGLVDSSGASASGP
mgnify:CR=1 FL=1